MAMQTLPNRQCITFLTDFGSQDSYVGQMKGVALGINPHAQLVDLTHEIAPGQVLRGAFVWSDAISAFPPGTIHVGVVDPGVGSQRRLIAAEIGEQRFVCPDNGLLTMITARLPVRRAVTLDRPQWFRPNVSNTFHGRDIMTPVAAAWSLGHDLLELGSEHLEPLVTLAPARLHRGKTSLSGVVIDVDRFGNAITNIDGAALPAHCQSLTVEVGSLKVDGLARCYSDVESGEPVALIGSSNRLEIAIRDGSAADELQVEYGLPIVVRWTGEPA